MSAGLKNLWALNIDAPASAADAVLENMPETSSGISAFKKNAEDRSPDPLWTVQGLYDEKPDIAALSVKLSVLSAVHKHAEYRIYFEHVPATGWLQKNQDSYMPIRVGRIVIHSDKKLGGVRPHEYGIELPVGAAFGTGEHPTTFGCLAALQLPGMLKCNMRVLDIGTGSGVLAFAAAKLKHARVIAGEMDKESVLIARMNVRRNGLRNRVRIEKAEGFRHRVIKRGKPYPLIVSNIFAKPLARLAPAMRAHVQPGGHVILAGLLHSDARLVQSAYASQRIHLKRHLRIAAWSILILRRPRNASRLLSKSR